MKQSLVVLLLLSSVCAGAAVAQSVDFIEPKDGADVQSPFKVKFGLQGMKVAPAGDMSEGTGHHHLLIDADDVAQGMVIPMDDHHRHFGKGQTEAELSLPPGRYRLTMQFADGAHRSYGEALRKTITVNVQ